MSSSSNSVHAILLGPPRSLKSQVLNEIKKANLGFEIIDTNDIFIHEFTKDKHLLYMNQLWLAREFLVRHSDQSGFQNIKVSSGCSHDVATIYPRYFTKLGYFSALEQKSLKDLAQNCFKQCFDGPFKHVHYFIYLKLRNPGQTAELYADDSSLTQIDGHHPNNFKLLAELYDDFYANIPVDQKVCIEIDENTDIEKISASVINAILFAALNNAV